MRIGHQGAERFAGSISAAVSGNELPVLISALPKQYLGFVKYKGGCRNTGFVDEVLELSRPKVVIRHAHTSSRPDDRQ